MKNQKVQTWRKEILESNHDSSTKTQPNTKTRQIACKGSTPNILALSLLVYFLLFSIITEASSSPESTSRTQWFTKQHNACKLQKHTISNLKYCYFYIQKFITKYSYLCVPRSDSSRTSMCIRMLWCMFILVAYTNKLGKVLAVKILVGMQV